MLKIFKLTIVAASVCCGGFQTANAGLIGMPLNLRATIESIDQSAMSVEAPTFHPRDIDDVIVDGNLLIEC